MSRPVPDATARKRGREQRELRKVNWSFGRQRLEGAGECGQAEPELGWEGRRSREGAAVSEGFGA